MNSVMSIKHGDFTIYATQDQNGYGFVVESDKAATYTLPGANYPTPEAAIIEGKCAADELLKTFPHIGQDVIADAASPTGLWLAKWDGTDWVPQTDANGMRIPARLK